MSTSEQHASLTARHAGRFARTRARMDYSYHARYSEARQGVQDEIISSLLLDPRKRAVEPWLVFTAGAMGAGKSHVMRSLASDGAFPLHRYVRVSADAIKPLLPEMRGLVESHRNLAGTLTHAESSYIAELVVREALEGGFNVLVDGSFRHAAWQEQELARVRRDHPHYRIAILFVRATPERVYERAERRSAVTGRVVPRSVLDATLREVPASFSRLAPKADYTAVILNDADAKPTLEEPATLEGFAKTFQLGPS